MIFDPLVHWMAHVGTGTWASFKRAASGLLNNREDEADQIRRLRFRLSDLGFAEFFVDGTDRWRAFSPLLASSSHSPEWALLCGARTPRLIQKVVSTAKRLDRRTFQLNVDDLFTVVKVVGLRLDEVANEAGVPFEGAIDRVLAGRLPSLRALLASAPRRPVPRGWSVKSFDLGTARWIDGEAPDTVREYLSPYLQRLYLLPTGDGEPIELPKREAIFAAASRKRHVLAKYDSAQKTLSTPVSAPLPEPHARAACIATGRASNIRNGSIVYDEIEPQLAAVLLVALDHLPPRFEFCKAAKKRTRA